MQPCGNCGPPAASPAPTLMGMTDVEGAKMDEYIDKVVHSLEIAALVESQALSIHAGRRRCSYPRRPSQANALTLEIWPF